jgi:tight adherence protein C
MTWALLVGAGFGVGVLLIWRGMFPAPVPLAVALARIDRPAASSEGEDRKSRLGAKLLEATEQLGLRFDRISADLAITERSLSRHLVEKVTLGLFGLLLGPLTSLVMFAGGVPLPLGIPLWAGLGLGVLFFFAPDIGVKGEAQRRRREFRHGLGSFLDLVVIGLAGGAGVESALDEAANASDNLASRHLRQCLTTTRLRAETPWVGLGRLGDDLAISELIELAASVGLAGAEGARVRQSLAAKAISLRAHQLAEAEAEAQSASEKMSMPVVLLFAGFLLFIGYPAISRVMTGL